MRLKLWQVVSIILLCPFFLTSGVSQDVSEEEQESANWKQVQMPFSYQNIQVPRELWQTVKDILRKDGASSEIIENFSVLPVSISVDLMSENKVALKNGLNYRVNYVEGGGEIDLFDYVVGKAPFYIRFFPELSSDYPLHLIYVSDSPGKEIEGKVWGNGCGQIYDLSQVKDQFIYDNGMPVTSSRRHYLHLMAGTFVFFQLVEERLFMGYIRVTDSRYPNFNCQEAQK